jgi:hypothetical protein
MGWTSPKVQTDNSASRGRKALNAKYSDLKKQQALIDERRRQQQEKANKILKDRQNKASGEYGVAYKDAQDEIRGFTKGFEGEQKAGFVNQINTAAVDIGDTLSSWMRENPEASEAEINMQTQKAIGEVSDLGNVLAHWTAMSEEYELAAELADNKEGALLADGPNSELILLKENEDAMELVREQDGSWTFALGGESAGLDEPIIFGASDFVKKANEGQAYFSKVAAVDPEEMRQAIDGFAKRKDERFGKQVGDQFVYDKEAIIDFIKNDPAGKTIMAPYLNSANAKGQFQYLNGGDVAFDEALFQDQLLESAMRNLPDKQFSKNPYAAEIKAEEKARIKAEEKAEEERIANLPSDYVEFAKNSGEYVNKPAELAAELNNYAREEGKAYRTGKEINDKLTPNQKTNMGLDDNKLYYGSDKAEDQREIKIGTPREVREAYGYGTGMKSADINEQEKKYGGTEESKVEVDKSRTDTYVANANALKETEANMKKMTEYTRSDKAKMSEEDLKKMKEATALYKKQKAALETAKKLGDAIKPFPPITLEEMGMKDVYNKENEAEEEKPTGPETSQDAMDNA